MSAALRIDQRRMWTLDDLDELPDDVDWRRFEIVDGALVVSPHATPRHDLAVAELMAAVRPFVPAGYRVIGSSMVDLHPSYRIPDLLVLADRAFGVDRRTVDPGDVLVAVEVESPSSVTTDRVTKPAQYAAGGIDNFWRVEFEPLRLHAYRRRGEAYEPAGSWGPGETARITEPFAVEIPIDTLLPPARD